MPGSILEIGYQNESGKVTRRRTRIVSSHDAAHASCTLDRLTGDKHLDRMAYYDPPPRGA